MDGTRVSLYDLSMDYFDGIRFLLWDRQPEYTHTVDRVFATHYGLQYNHGGRIRYAFGDSALRTTEGPHAWVTFPGIRFRYGPDRGGSRFHRYVAFVGPRTEVYRRTGLLPVRSHPALIPITRSERFARDMDRLFDCLGEGLRYTPSRTIRKGRLPVGGHPRDLPSAVHMLEGLLLQLHRQPEQPRGGRFDQPMRALAARIRAQPERDWDFRAESRRLSISYAHFRRVFRQTIGTPPGQFVQISRLERAAQLLRNTSAAVQRVAHDVGMPDIYYFTKLFRRHFHTPPARYRKEFSKT